MVMDRGLSELSSMMNGRIKFGDYRPDRNLCRGFRPAAPLPVPFLDQSAMNPNAHDLGPSVGSGTEEDSEIFSDIALKYISQMLMEEDMEEKSYLHHESLALQAAEKPFYDILGKKYPPSPDQSPLYTVNHNSDSPDDYVSGSYSNYNSGGSNGVVDGSCICNVGENPSSRNVLTVSTDYTSHSPFSSSSSVVVDGLEESPTNENRVSDFISESQPIWQFKRGIEEARKFLPSGVNLVLGVESNGFLFREPKQEVHKFEVKEEKDKRDFSVNGSRVRKNPHWEDLDLEGRSNKQSAVYSEEIVRSEVFDMVLLCGGRFGPLSCLRADLRNGVSKNSQKGQSKGSNGGAKSRGKKQGKKEVVDLRTLLIQCAQAVAADDRRNANELLKQIRQHSSPFGDGSQRQAHYFANGLEARLAGTGSQIYAALSTKRTTAADILKAYHLYLAACPFKKISHFFANQTIVSAVENATRLHIIDFGIYFGFQWPCLLQRLSGRPGGPPKIRITGIDFPQPGFRPAERTELSGRRLADYARTFNIPFEYVPIACKWETIQVEDLKIDRDEVLVVNCLYRAKKMFDETVVVDSPRDIFLNTIRKMNPDVFIHGIVNGAFSAPFFVTRFREALFHWSALYDMLEVNVPREHPERILIEREIFGQDALNVIACEGSERVERPETYKQWQVRNLRAGFKQLPLNHAIMEKARDRVRSCYHKDFVIDEDSQWMLQGWKGRIIYALSTWKPDHDSF
ncbi:scarecrow-like protein 9 [Magnolia sinica]|uniref:scarecrow-like protein 9 n=1 Tax=Magnolia sinica TaxID=86752 RepID=UPI00265A8E3D|nr:scarecrow-like protein 9 [Magnolia sinica]